MTDYPGTDVTRTGGQTRTVTAFFDSQADADKARTDLISAGVSPDTISVLGGADTAGTAPVEEGGFWHALKEFFIPDEDRYTFAEGLRRGGYALSVRTGEDHYDRALDILDADGAVDIDEREQSWRSEGWTGFQPGADPLSSDLGYEGGDAGTAGFAASRAGDDGYAPPASVTTKGTEGSESRADTGRVGTGPNEPGLLNPDFRERIGSGTASMTPPTPTGAQDATMGNNAATSDRGGSSYTTAADAEDAALGSPTRSGAEEPSAPTTVGSTTSAEAGAGQKIVADAWSSRRDDQVTRSRVRGYIIDPENRSAASGI